MDFLIFMGLFDDKKKKEDISSNASEWKFFIVQCGFQKHALLCPAYDEYL